MKFRTKPKSDEIQSFVGHIDGEGRLQLPDEMLRVINRQIPGVVLIESDGICLLISPMPLRDASA